MKMTSAGLRLCLVCACGVVVAACTGPCGLFTYCAFDRKQPPPDTFIVNTDGSVLVGGVRGHSMAGRGIYPAGTQTVVVGHASDDDDDTAPSGPAVALGVTAAAGDVLMASCFQYNGPTKLFGWLHEILYGFEIRNAATGQLLAQHPARSVTRRRGSC